MPREILERVEEDSGGVLGAREMEILQLSADGLSNHQVASRLHVARSTIKGHLVNTYEKMEVDSWSETIRKALAGRWATIQKTTKQEEDYARSHIYRPRPGKHVRWEAHVVKALGQRACSGSGVGLAGKKGKE